MVVVAFVGGAFAAFVLWQLMAPAFAAEIFTRQNFRERDLPTAVGVIIPLVVLLGAALVVLAQTLDADLDQRLVGGMQAAALVSVGFALVGLFDDLGGVGQSGGFRGHLTALARGQLTTGGVKVLGGAAVGMIAVGYWYGDNVSVWRLLADGALIALAANLGNLFDRAPGRVTKVSLLGGLLLVIGVGLDDSLVGVALALGAGAGLLWPDLRERMMLGDAGANVLGAVVGLGVVTNCSTLTRTVVLLVLAALNALSEKVSFSRVIKQVAPLRAVDMLGREP